MKIDVFIEQEQRKETIAFTGSCVKELLCEMQINSETVLVVRDGEVLTDDVELEDGERVELLSVVSGG